MRYCVIKNSILRCIQPFPNYNEDLMPQPCNEVIKYKGNAISKYIRCVCSYMKIFMQRTDVI